MLAQRLKIYISKDKEIKNDQIIIKGLNLPKTHSIGILYGI